MSDGDYVVSRHRSADTFKREVADRFDGNGAFDGQQDAWTDEDLAGARFVAETRAEEGDLVRLLSRTGEALLQIAGLRETHSQAANLAARTAEIMLREPVR